MSLFAKAIQSLWHDSCTIIVKDKVRQGAITKYKDVDLYKDIPCRLSYDTNPVASESNTVTAVRQTITLFLPTDVNVPDGAKISVNRKGITTLYKRSSHIKIHSNHIEVNVELDTEA